MHAVDLFGYLGALLTLATFSMKTMRHLRLLGIGANLAFIAYGTAAGVTPVLLLHLALLPLNVWRLRQLQHLTRRIAVASTRDFDVQWLRPFSRFERVEAGTRLFSRGDAASEVLFVLRGRFRAVESGVALEIGAMFGELGLVARDHRRTQTVVCEVAGELLRISYDEVRQMYFQNPAFGFYFLQLVAERLMKDEQRAGQARDPLPTTAA